MAQPRSYIVAALQSVWPYLVDGLPAPTHLAVPDTEYDLPSLEELRAMLPPALVRAKARRCRWWDCDDWAFWAAAEIRAAWGGTADAAWWRRLFRQPACRGDCPPAFGEAWGTRFHGWDATHAVNVAVTSDAGAALVEPQSGEIWLAHAGRDVVDYVRM